MYTCNCCERDYAEPASLELVRNVESGKRHWLCLSCRKAVREVDREYDGPERPNWLPAWRRRAG